MSDMMLEILILQVYGFAILSCLFFLFAVITFAFIIVLVCLENSKFSKSFEAVNTLTDVLGSATRSILIGLVFDIIAFFMSGMIMLLTMIIETAIT